MIQLEEKYLGDGYLRLLVNNGVYLVEFIYDDGKLYPNFILETLDYEDAILAYEEY